MQLPIEDLISVFIILIAVIINLIIGIKSYKSYRENHLTQTLLFAITAFFMAFAMIFLVVEKAFLSSLMPDEVLGMLFGGIAITLSGVAVVAIDAFSFNMVFPNKFKILTIFAILVEVFYLAMWWSDPERAVSWSGSTGEITLGTFTTMLPYFTLVPLLVIPILVFFYYAIKVRSESPISSKRSVMLGMGVLVIATGFTIEIVGLSPILFPWAVYVIVIGRAMFILGAILLYWGLFRVKAKE
ncbi:MAG TPA: hypothetical protein VMV49_16595 [Candidatus Deferrimicrobium sp.]|nr:hypothetical protein [Candidatus Deferrimicrobium sp.]